MKLLSLLLLAISTVEAYKILVYSPFFGHSHMKFMGSIADVLTDAGHDVTVLMPVFDIVSYKNKATAIKRTKKIIFVDPHPDFANADVDALRSKMMGGVWTEDSTNPLTFGKKINDFAEKFKKSCEPVIGNKTLIQQLKDEKFDLAILEPFYQCPFGLLQAIGLDSYVSAVAASRMDHVSNAIGEPSATSFVPATLTSFTNNMGVLERLQNTVMYAFGSFFFSHIGDKEYEIVHKHYPEARPWRELLAESVFIFTNAIPFLDYPAPTFNKVVPIGGVAVNMKKSANKLDEKWEKILSERKNTVLVSFGSNARSIDMPELYKQQMKELFKSMPETTFIWKYEEADTKIVDGIPNVHTSTWVPQNELLADPRLTLFVTHGGMASITELVSFGKPSVTVPLFADQPKNAKMLARHGGSILVEKESLADYRNLKKAIETVLSDGKYLKNAQRLGEIINNQPVEAKETLVKYVEFAARFGKQPHADPIGRKLSLIQYFNLDGLAIVLAVVSLVLFILYKLGRIVVRKVFCRSCQKTKTE